MAKVGAPPQTLVAILGTQRREARQAAAPEAILPELRSQSRKFNADALTSAGVPEKIATVHGVALAKAQAEISELAQLPLRLEAWQQKAVGRTVEQLYKTLGQLLSATPEAERPKAAKAALRGILAVVEATPKASILPALAALNGVVDAGLRLHARQGLALEAQALSVLYGDGAQAVRALTARLAGRTGLGSALHVYPRLLEQLQLGEGPLSREAHLALLKGVSDYLDRAPPRTGFNLAIVANLAADLEAEKAAPEPLAAALARFHGRTADLFEATRAGLANGADPEGAAGTGHDRLRQALAKVVEANPAGPASLFEAVDHLRAAAAEGADTPDWRALLSTTAKVVARLAETPGADGLLRFVAQNLGDLSVVDDARASLEQAAASRGAPLAIELVKVAIQLRGVEPDRTLNKTLSTLEDYSPGLALSVAALLVQGLGDQDPTPELLKPMIEIASRGSESPAVELERYLSNSAVVQGAIRHRYYGNPVAPELIALTAALPLALDQERATSLIQGLSTIRQALPKLPLEDLLADDARGRPGLLSLTDPKFAEGAPLDLFGTLVEASARSTAGSPVRQREMIRLALALSREVSLVRAGRELIEPRVQADFKTAIGSPKKLNVPSSGGSVVATRAQTSSAQAYADQHPEFPIDLVFTAGLHLPSEDLGWLSERALTLRGRDSVRALRDAVFAAVNLKKLGLISALRTSTSPEPAKLGVIRAVSQAFRVDQLEQVDFAGLIAGLKQGGDPVAESLKARAQKAFVDLDLAVLAEGKVTESGLAEITALAPNIAELLEQYRAGFVSMDRQIDMGQLGPVLKEVLKSVLQGTWPQPKYEDAVGVRQLAILNPAQQAIWRSSTITADDQVAPGQDAAASAQVLPLLKGLSKLLSEHVQLKASGLPDLRFDAASLKRVRAAHEAAVEAIRKTHKGSRAQKSLAKQLGQLTEVLAILELQTGIKRALREAGKDGLRALRQAQPELEAAQPALRKLQSAGIIAAVADLLALAPVQASAGRQGRHAADDDSLTALIASHRSGCLSMGSNLRRWGMAGSLSDANTKILRAFDGDRQLYRTYLRLVPVKFTGYQGPALYIESPIADGGGNHQDLELMYRGLYAKAEAMGIPAMGAAVPPGWEQGKGQLQLTYDYGHTGLYHSDRNGQQINQGNGGKSWVAQPYNLTIAIPPTLKLRG